MKKFFIFLIISYLFFGIIISRFELDILPTSIEHTKHPLFFDYKGVTHTIADKTLDSPPPLHIIEDAKRADLKFLFITDINQFENYSISKGYRNEVLVYINPKVSYLDDHFLIYQNSDQVLFKDLGHAHAVITDLLSNDQPKDQVVVLAHPLKSVTNINEVKRQPGLDGIEIINLRKMWQEVWKTENYSFIWSLIIYPFNSHLALFRLIKFPEQECKLWDQLLSKRRTIGFLGNQTTSKILKWGQFEFRFPTYYQSFSFASNHLLMRSELTGNYERDRVKVFEAIRNGQFYMALDALGDPSGFAAYMKSKDKIYSLGSEIKVTPGLELIVDLPIKPSIPFEVALFKNGVRHEISNFKNSRWKITEPGVYRVMVRVIPTLPLPDGKRWFPWIYTNPFYVK